MIAIKPLIAASIMIKHKQVKTTKQSSSKKKLTINFDINNSNSSRHIKSSKIYKARII